MQDAFSTDIIKQWRTDYKLFERMMFPETRCFDRQYDIWDSIIKFPRIACKAAYGSGKSFLAARVAIWFFLSYPHSIVLTTAPNYTLCASILWKEIYSQWNEIERMFQSYGQTLPFKKFETLKFVNPTDPGHYMMGFTTEAKSQADESFGSRFQGIHAPNLLIIIDESAGVKKYIFEGAAVMATSPNSKILCIGNSTDPLCHFAKLFTTTGPETPSGWKKLTISAFETPNIKAGKIVNPNFQSLDWLEYMRDTYGETSDEWKVKVLGEFPDLSQDRLIPLRFVEYACTRRPEDINDESVNDICVLGIDSAGEGKDYHVATLLQGSTAKLVYYKQKSNTDALVGVYDEIIKREGVKRIAMDMGGGWGIGVRDGLRRLGYKTIDYHSDGDPTDPKKYANQRTESAFALKQRLEKENICLYNDDMLKRQISLLKTSYTVKGGRSVNKLMKKDQEVKQLSGKSPDKLDSLLIAFSCLTKPKGQALTILQQGDEFGRWEDDW